MKDSKAHEDWIKSTTPQERKTLRLRGQAWEREAKRLDALLEEHGVTDLSELWDSPQERL